MESLLVFGAAFIGGFVFGDAFGARIVSSIKAEIASLEARILAAIEKKV